MSNNQVTLCLKELFEESCVELFLDIHCEIQNYNGQQLDTIELPHAHIDGGCQDFELDLHLSLPYSTLAMTYPVQCDIASIDDVALEDWLRELSNRLLGKLKRNLLGYGINLAMGLPEYSWGYAHHRQDDKTQGTRYRCTYEIDRQPFEAGIFMEIFNHDLVLVRQYPDPNISPNSVADGDVELF